MIRKTKRSVRGVSLIEFIIVALILTVTGSIAFPLYTASQANARLLACKGYMASIYEAEESYRTRNRSYTNNISDLDSLIGPNITCPADGSPYQLGPGETGNYNTSLKIYCTSMHGHSENPVYDPSDSLADNPWVFTPEELPAGSENSRSAWQLKGKP